MRRVPSDPRTGWRETVEAQGLVFPTTVHEDGSETPYWDETACYVLDLPEVDELERVTELLHGMCVEAGRFLATGAMGDLGLPPGGLELALASLEADPPSLYGRFDLRHDGLGPAKLLEYNADTPTGLVESAVIQWHWLESRHPDRDQWNSVHDRLVLAWQAMADRLPSPLVHFAHHSEEPTGEEWMTAAYLRDTAEQAGLVTQAVPIDQLGWDGKRFVDLDTEPVDTCFKLYPWETMLHEEFGALVMADPVHTGGTVWLEPVWKVLLSNKALLAALWHLYPGHENLLPAYLGEPGPLREWVAKPLHGREGDSIRVHADGVELEQPGDYGAEGFCYQQWAPLPVYDGAKAVLGSWVVDGKSAGVGIRESESWITDFDARFVPHYVDAARPDDDTVAAWLAE